MNNSHIEIPDWPESYSLADLEYAQRTPDDWSPEHAHAWQRWQVTWSNNIMLRKYIRELREIISILKSQSKFIGLTEEERDEICLGDEAIARAIEAKLKEKNGY